MKRWVRRLGIGIVAVGGIVLICLVAVYGLSAQRLSRRLDVPVRDTVAIPVDSASIARGEHLVTAVTNCMECHGADLGGKLFVDAGPLIGEIYTPNLTRGAGGIGASFTSADWARALRHGVAPDGHALMIMPAEAFTYLSDRDMADIIAYVRTRAPVDRSPGRSTVGPLARMLYLTGQFPLLPSEHIDHRMPRPAAVTPTVTREYGEYLVHIAGCAQCHGQDLSGGPIAGAPPGTPPAQDLTPAGIGGWTEADFFHAIRTGQRPDGSVINPYMPWLTFRNMTDDELRAIWLYLRHLPPRSVVLH